MLRSLFRPTAIAAVACAFACVQADTLRAFPTLSVADGRSTTTITADVRDSGGHPVPDGTRVVFSTTLGTFRETLVTTSNGLARAVLVSGGTAGIAKITATPLSGGGSPSTLEFEFVADRAMLSSAREYIEIVAPGLMQYTVDTRLIGASGPSKSVSVRYRDISIDADDVQISIGTYEVRARKARLRIGKINKDFDELYLRLNTRRGYGTTAFRGRAPQSLVIQGLWPAFATEKDDGTLSYDVPPEQDRYGLVEIKGASVTPAMTHAPANIFAFRDMAGSPSRVSAKKAVVFPNKQIQFQKADVYVAEARVMRLPLFQVNLQQSGSPVVTEQLVNVNDNQLQVNYPYFLTLKPGQESLLRFRTGDTYGRGATSGTGAYLDYEMNWNRGDQMQGGFAIRNIGRDTYRIGLQQYLHIDDRSTASAQIEMPAGKSIFGSGSINRQFDGYQVSLSGSATRTIRGIQTTASDVQFLAERDPIKLGRSPFQLTYGLTAMESKSSLVGNRTMRGVGLETRLQSSAITLDSTTNVTTSLNISHLTGQNTLSGLTIGANTTLSKRLSKDASTLITYGYLQDGYNDRALGHHQISADTYWSSGNLDLRFFASKSLDVDRVSLMGDFGFKISPIWRISSSYTYDRYTLASASTSFLDYNIAIGYRLGWREIGLVWSRQTNRIGIQLLGATLN